MRAKPSLIAMAAAAAFGITATAAFAEEAGFGGHGATSKNQVPGPGVSNPSDPAAGNPGSAAQVPTAPEVQDDLNNSDNTAPGSSATVMPKPQSSNPTSQQ
jgi:hypothetical protein